MLVRDADGTRKVINVTRALCLVNVMELPGNHPTYTRVECVGVRVHAPTSTTLFSL